MEPGLYINILLLEVLLLKHIKNLNIMKNINTVLIIITLLIAAGCRNNTTAYVYLGQLYSTFGHGMQEKIKGEVKEFRQTHFWAEEVNGKIVKGRAYTIEDRKTDPLGRDYAEEFNPSGGVVRSTTFDDNGNIILEVKVETEGKILRSSEYYMISTLRNRVTYRYEGERMVEAFTKDPANDTLMMSIKYEYDQVGNIVKTQNFNFRNEPQGYNTIERNENGSPIKTRSYNNDGKLTSLHDYTYNEKGERIGHHEENFNSGHTLDLTFKYEYDNIGNYTAIIFMRDGKPFIYRVREITYYE